MDYEKKYNEALERARALWREAIEKEYVIDYLKDYETIFPELRKSEDERIRKFLKDYAIEMIAGLESDISISVYDGVNGHDPDAEEELEKWREARAWLENQKEQKPLETPSPSVIYTEQGEVLAEQKPAGWSEGNKQWLDAIIKDYEDSLSGDEDHDPAIQIKINLLKSLRPQPKQDWSEEDEKIISEACYSINEYARSIKKLHFTKSLELFRLCEKLKSLRPCPSWKPSEEDKEMKLKILKYLSTRCSVEQFEEVEEWLNNKLK